MTNRLQYIRDLALRRPMLVALAISVLSLVIQIVLLRPPLTFGEPLYIASNVLNGLGFSSITPFVPETRIHAYISPLYVYILCSAIGYSFVTIQIFNLLLLQAGNWVVYKFFGQVTTQGIALLGHLALSFYVPLWLLSECIDPNSLNYFLLALTVLVLYNQVRKPERRNWIVLGILIGLQCLVRPDIAIGVMCFAIFLLATATGGRKEILGGLLGSCIIAFAMMLPWIIRNYLTFHEFIPLSANGGFNLYVGNNRSATGDFYYERVSHEAFLERATLTAYGESHTQPEFDSFLMKRALDWMIHHPLEVVKVDLKKLYMHWVGKPPTLDRPQLSAHEGSFFVMNVCLAIFGFLGLFSLRDKEARNLLLTLFLYSTLVSVIFFVQTRHKMLKEDPFLVYLSVIFFATITRRMKSFSSRSL
jgi:hypothetical protein